MVSIIFLFIVAKYTYPFIIALILAILINPIVNFLETKGKLSRPFAVIISITSILVIITGILALLVVELINGSTYLAEHLPKHFQAFVVMFQEMITDKLIPIYQRIISMVSMLEESQQNMIMDHIQRLGNNIAANGGTIIQSMLQVIPRTLASLPSYMTVFIFSLLGTFFISKDWYKLMDWLRKTVPQSFIDSSHNVGKGLKRAFLGFIKAQLTLIMITAVIVFIGLIILKVDHAITIAVITGAIDLLPYLGTGIVFIPWILYMFFKGNYFLTIGLSILYITIVVQRQMMEPKVLSSNIGLNPLATLVAIFVGFQLWGFAGLIIGPVFLVVINTLYQTGVLKQIWNYIKGDIHSEK